MLGVAAFSQLGMASVKSQGGHAERSSSEGGGRGGGGRGREGAGKEGAGGYSGSSC